MYVILLLYQLSTYNDERLISLLKGEDVLAFKEIYNRYWKLLFCIVEKKLQNLQDTEELVQDVFADLWIRRHEVSIKYSIKSYLVGMAKFKVYTKMAKRFRERQLSKDYTEFKEKLCYSITQIEFSTMPLQKELIKTINSLPEKCRLVYQLSREQGLSNRQIASTLSISEKTVENQITRALKKIKGALTHLASLFLLIF